MHDFSFGQFILQFVNTILAVLIAGGGIWVFIDRRFKTVFTRIDDNQKEVEDKYVLKIMHEKDLLHLKELNDEKIRSMLAVMETEFRFVNEKLDTLIKHDEKRNGSN